MDIIVRQMQSIVVVCALGATIALLPTPASAQVFVYSAMYLCGTLGGPDQAPAGKEGVAKPANYATAINVHNFLGQPIAFTKRAVIANPQGEPRGKISARREDRLGPDEALEVDCPDIAKLLGGVVGDLKFMKGFVVIESKTELDVVAVTTARSIRPATAGGGIGFGLDVTYVSPKKRP